MGISEEKKIKLENKRKYKNEKMKSYDWYCDICNNGKNYTLRGKFMHLKTNKHVRNYYKDKPLIVF